MVKSLEFCSDFTEKSVVERHDLFFFSVFCGHLFSPDFHDISVLSDCFFFLSKKHLEGARLLRSELPPSSSDQQIGLDGIVKS